jgi:hypothetical protein
MVKILSMFERNDFMLVTFDYSLCYGKGDYGEAYIEMELTEEEYGRLQKAKESGEDFFDCESIKDIYDKAYALADEDATNDLIAVDVLDKGKKASELYPIEVYFPEE